MKFTFSDQAAVKSAVDALHGGAVIAYPTEAVFGLGCDPCNENAITAILRLKGRSSSKGLIVTRRLAPYPSYVRFLKARATSPSLHREQPQRDRAHGGTEHEFGDRHRQDSQQMLDCKINLYRATRQTRARLRCP